MATKSQRYKGLIHMIHPTQCTVGYAEVAVKMEELSNYEKAGTLEKYLRLKTIPCVLGPDKVVYITDHHHMGLALTILATEWSEKNPKKEEKLNPFISCTFEILYDFSKTKLSKKDFFKVLESLSFTHPYDENGKKVETIPQRLIDLKNDSYRSLAGIVRKSGGFEKVKEFYLEFVWANFFRTKIIKEELDKNFKKCVSKAIGIALSDEANHLPGWTGLEIMNSMKSGYMDRINNAKTKINKIASDLEVVVEAAKDKQPHEKAIKFNKQ